MPTSASTRAERRLGLSQQERGERVYYAEGWKKGSRLVQEQKFSIRLDAYHASYDAVVKGAGEVLQYQLRIQPYYYVRDRESDWKLQQTPELGRDDSVNFWNVCLFEPEDKASLLVAVRQQGHTIEMVNYYPSLVPVEDDWRKVGLIGVPILSKRVIKVEGFYCVIQVRSYQMSRTQSRAFEFVDVEIEFTNTKPDLGTTDQK